MFGLVRGKLLQGPAATIVVLVFAVVGTSGCGAQSSQPKKPSRGSADTFAIRSQNRALTYVVRATDVDIGETHLDAANGTTFLHIALTNSGSKVFRRLTAALARRGARLRKPQVFVVTAGGHRYAQVAVDYSLFPNGFTGRSGIDIALRKRAARALLQNLRDARR
jgi:hypothetical protein